MAERPSPGRRREPVVHVAAGLLGPLLGMLLLRTTAAALVWRSAGLAIALTLVGAGLVRAVALGRAEWLRQPPAGRAYAGVVARFVAAFVLVVVATA